VALGFHTKSISSKTSTVPLGPRDIWFHWGRLMGRFELLEMAEAMGSASDEDTRRTSQRGENPSTNAALLPPDVYGLISMVL